MSALESLPEWLVAARAQGAARLVDAPAPDTTDEVWRYSRIDDVPLRDFSTIDAPSSRADAIADVEGAIAHFVMRDGWLTDSTVEDLGTAYAGRLADHPDGQSILEQFDSGEDIVAHLHSSAMADALLIDVPRGVHLAGAIVIDHFSDVAGGVTAPRTIVRAAAGAGVTVLERRRSGAADQLVVPMVNLEADNDANLRYLVIQELGENTVSLEQISSEARQQAHVISAMAAFGGSYARSRSDFRLTGRGASGDLLAVYFGDGDQMLDFRTFQEHAGPDTTSNLLFKGAVTGKAHSVYSGLIRVDESAPGTDAYQTNRNLKLSEDAWAYTVPNLEIEQNQVSCSHASTVGEIDEQQQFYLESRGVPTTEAEQLLVSGFFAEVIDKLPVLDVQAELRATIDAALLADREFQKASA